MSNIEKGKYGENLACKYLEKSGYKIVDKNYKYSKYGEVDIIALDRDNTLCFVEVKTRTNNKFGAPLEAVTKEKLSKIIACAQNYKKTCKIKYSRTRIDAISVTLNEKETIEHIKNIEI